MGEFKHLLTSQCLTMNLKPLPLEIDDTNPTANDALNRGDFIKSISDLIRDASGPLVLGIDSPWGTGKTTFFRMLEKSLVKDSYACLYFNAWETDFAEDPLVAFVGEISELIKSIDENAFAREECIKTTRKVTTAIAKRGIPALLKLATLGALDLQKEYEAVIASLSEGLMGDAVDDYIKEKGLIDEFKKEINKTIGLISNFNKKLPMVIMIDELDRCKPSYAIMLLERIKHLFDIPNAIFILGIDKKQLSISMGAVYGQGFDGVEYLRRFIDFDFKLMNVDSDTFYNSLVKRMNCESAFNELPRDCAITNAEGLSEYFRFYADTFNLSLRKQESLLSILALVLRNHDKKLPLPLPEILFLASARISNEPLYKEVILGHQSIMELIAIVDNEVWNKETLINSSWWPVRGGLLALGTELDIKAYKELSRIKKLTEKQKKKERIDHQGLMNRSKQIIDSNLSVRKIAKKIDLAAQFFHD